MEKKHPNLSSSDAVLRLKAVIETAIDGIVTINERGIVESINPAAANLFGYQEEEVIGNNIHMLMPEPYHSEHDAYLDRYHQTGKAHIIGIGREVRGLRKDGTIFPMRLAVSEINLKNRQIFTGIVHDLSEVHQAKEEIMILNRELENMVKERTEKLAYAVEQLLQINQKLEEEIHERLLVEEALRASEAELIVALEKEKELNELKSRFVSMASHEFRTPLSTILSSVELVEAYDKEAQKQRREKHIARIKNSVTYLTGILNDFLSLSRMEEGKVQFQPEVFSFQGLCKETIEEMKLQLKPGQTLIHTNPNAGQEIYFDKNALRHVMSNLLSNAIKYSEEGKPIECISKITDTKLKITIKDQGIGIPEDEQKYLFTRFFRAHNVENIKGTGLGLNIVRRFVDMLGGKIEFTSVLGKGTTFEVTFPLNS